MITIEVPINDKKKPPSLKFPDRCAHCGKPKHKILPLKLNMGVQAKNGQVVIMDLPVPLCADCELKERRISYVTLFPFAIVGLLTCVLVFIPVWLITPDGTTPQTIGFSLVVGAFAGLLAGIIGGTVVELGLKFLLSPVYGPLLMKRTLSVFSMFTDSEDVIGLSVKFTQGKSSLQLTFENEEIAREFDGLNSEEK